MKRLPFKIGFLGIALLLLFAFSTGFANDSQDFEQLLQEALRANPNSAAGDANSDRTGLTAPRSAAVPPRREPQPVPTPGGPARTVTTRPIAPGGAPAANARTASPTVISDGWTTIEPNDPSIVVPEPQIVSPPPARPPAQEPVADPSAETDDARKPVELFEPDPIAQTPAIGTDAAPLFPEDMFDVEAVIIDEESGENLSEPIRGSADIEELGIITEPRRRGEPREPFPVAPVEKGELSDLFLDDLANERIEEPKEEVSEEPAGESVPEKTQVTVVIPDFDCDDDETVWKMIDPSLVGDPHVVDKLKLMYDEIMNGLRSRNITNRYEMWKTFGRGIMRDTSGINTRSELDGRARLSWFLKLFDEPIRSTFEVEEYSRELHAGLSGNHRHLAELMPGIRERMDIAPREDAGIRFPLCTTPQEALAEVKRCLLIAASSHSRAFSTLFPSEMTDLEQNLAETFVGRNVINGHTIPARSVGRRLCDVFVKVDMAAMYDGAEAMIPLTNTALLDLLTQFPEDVLPQVTINGQRFQRLTTAAGDIIIGGRGRDNVYDLDSPEMRDVICVISLGNNDTFREGTCNMDRPVFVVLALGRQNTFVGTRPGIQGGSIMGISLLVDRGSGNSTYRAADVAQGSTMGGVGILVNFEGGNRYEARRRVQGHALLGLGMLIDRGAGNASYKAALWAQGYGAPGGFGILSNSGNGNNHYYCGGLYIDSYPEHPGYDGWGQGVGAGIRQVANGGIGVILSGTGDDVYEVDYFGMGGGYWLGVGIARDFGGNDIRHGTTLTTFDGRARSRGSEPGARGAERQWTRFVNGWGCHYAVGYLFDDGGNDIYGGQIMGTGMAWDLAFGILADFSGSGRYTSTGNMKHGVGAEASIGILFSYGGDDVFAGRSQGLATTNVTYHPPAAGGNFSFLINYGGNNQYGTGNQRVAQRHSFVQRGSPSGFLIDRPTESEAVEAIAALRLAIETRNQEIAEYDAMIAQRREEFAQRRQQYRPPAQRRPVPITETQLISAVPDFDPNVRSAATDTRTGATETNVR